MENNVVSDMITDAHKELIRKGITKAIKNIDFEDIVTNFIEKEFEYASEQCGVANAIDEHITEVIRQHLVKSGLLKDRG